MLAGVYTRVGFCLRLRARVRDTILMESTDFNAGENSYSFIGINAVAGVIAASDPQKELSEMNNKREVLKRPLDWHKIFVPISLKGYF